MKSNIKKNEPLTSVYRIYKNNSNILFLSHTIDSEHDTVERLKAYTKVTEYLINGIL
ncbi:protein SCO1/2 [Flavobacterium tructae]